jgi:hypothetical protein
LIFWARDSAKVSRRFIIFFATMSSAAAIPAAFPVWGWVLTSLLMGWSGGMVTMFYLHWGARRVYCPRCIYYLHWRDMIHSEIIRREPPGKSGEHGSITIHRTHPEPW